MLHRQPGPLKSPGCVRPMVYKEACVVMTEASIARYPKYLTLRDGTTAEIRPMIPQDVPMLTEFFHRIPEEDRFYMKDDVLSPDVLAGWAQNLNYERVLPLVAEEEGRIVANATLH